jgi:hypothetical protein
MVIAHFFMNAFEIEGSELRDRDGDLLLPTAADTPALMNPARSILLCATDPF